MINSRKLDDLDPDPRKVCLSMLAECHQRGIELIVTSTWRDFEAQEDLYAIGRTKELGRKPVTQARGGQSWHNFKVAWDVVPVVSGKPIWEDTNPVWREVVKIGRAAGAEAGADWRTFKDFPHFQLRPSVYGSLMTLAQALDRFKENGTIFSA